MQETNQPLHYSLHCSFFRQDHCRGVIRQRLATAEARVVPPDKGCYVLERVFNHRIMINV
jgi:hypothetical protein